MKPRSELAKNQTTQESVEVNAKQLYRGVLVPLVSTLGDDGKADPRSAERLSAHVSGNGCAPFVLGTTGESASLTLEDKVNLVQAVAEGADGQQLVYAGISDTCTENCIKLAHRFAEVGADVAVAHLPSYYPLGEDLMRKWYLRMADACPLPLMLYNIPVTTNMSLPLALIDELSSHPNIVGFKDSERGDERLSEACALWKKRDDFTFHIGWAARSYEGLTQGADGIVPATANLIPAAFRAIVDHVESGEFKKARAVQERVSPVSAYYQSDRTLAEFLPLFKGMLSSRGLCGPAVAPPLETLGQSALNKVGEDTAKLLANGF